MRRQIAASADRVDLSSGVVPLHLLLLLLLLFFLPLVQHVDPFVLVCKRLEVAMYIHPLDSSRGESNDSRYIPTFPLVVGSVPTSSASEIATKLLVADTFKPLLLNTFWFNFTAAQFK